MNEVMKPAATPTDRTPEGQAVSYVAAARVEEIADRTAKTVVVRGHKIAIARVDERYFAVDALCSHMGVPLDGGSVTGDHAGGEITCPWHSARFCLQTGVKKSGPGACGLKTYPVRVVEQTIELLVPVEEKKRFRSPFEAPAPVPSPAIA